MALKYIFGKLTSILLIPFISLVRKVVQVPPSAFASMDKWIVFFCGV